MLRKLTDYKGLNNSQNYRERNKYMEIVKRDKPMEECRSFRVKIKGQEFLFREDADGLYISKVESSKGKDVITIQPKVANAIVID